eukprot:1507975-Pleurochrysis_carterae.AAC.2
MRAAVSLARRQANNASRYARTARRSARLRCHACARNTHDFAIVQPNFALEAASNYGNSLLSPS